MGEKKGGGGKDWRAEGGQQVLLTESHAHTHSLKSTPISPYLSSPTIKPFPFLPSLPFLLLTFVLGLLGIRPIIRPACHQGLADRGRLVARVQTALVRADLGGQKGGVRLCGKMGKGRGRGGRGEMDGRVARLFS